MSKFKAGDEVVCIDVTDRHDLVYGKTYTIDKIDTVDKIIGRTNVFFYLSDVTIPVAISRMVHAYGELFNEE